MGQANRQPGAGTVRNDGTAERAKDGAQQMRNDAGQQASDMASKVTDQADKGMEKAAESLTSASQQIRERAEEQGGMQAQVGTKVADDLDKTSEYLETHDSKQVMDDIETYVKEHPMMAVAGAVVGGFVLARVLR